MASEPISIFTRNAEPAKVARLLRELVPGVKIDGPDDSWRTAVVRVGKFLRKRTLTISHDQAYYSEPNWSRRMDGMQGYFARFPETERKQKALMLPTTFRFSLGTVFDSDYDGTGDPRLDVLFRVAEALDGVLFTPSALRDARGRILFGAGGEDDEDPAAVWPKVIASVTVDPSAREEAPETADDPAAEVPTADRAARRALALAAVTCRAILEQEWKGRKAAATHRDLVAWIEDVGLGGELTPDEWEVIQTPLGRLKGQSLIDSTWRLEGLVVLAWALGRFAVPTHDKLVETNRLWESLSLFDADAAKELIAGATLRDRTELGEFRARMFALHWRLRNYRLNSEVLNFAEFAKTCWFGPLNISGLPLLKGDLAVGGKRLDRADGEEVAKANSAVMERHKAANWLWEGPAEYSEASEAT